MVDDLGNIEAAMDTTVGEDDTSWCVGQHGHSMLKSSSCTTGTFNLEPGEYCGSLALVDSQGVTVDTYEDDRMCMTVEELPEFLQTLETIGEAFGESNFESTLEAFGENLEDRLGSITEDIAYTGANFVMLWSRDDVGPEEDGSGDGGGDDTSSDAPAASEEESVNRLDRAIAADSP